MIKSKKAQIFTMDFFMALFVFFVLLVVVMVSWNNYHARINERTEYNNMMTKAFQLSNVLVKSRGYPSNWTSENVKIIGLAKSDRNLSSVKVDAFVNMPLSVSEKIFQTYDSNFYFTIKNLNGEILKECGTNPLDVKKSASSRRYVLYNSEEAVVDFMLWK